MTQRHNKARDSLCDISILVYKHVLHHMSITQFIISVDGGLSNEANCMHPKTCGQKIVF